MFHRPKPVAAGEHRFGQLAIAVTEIRPDDTRRDETTHPETVVRHLPLTDGVSRDYAFERAQLMHAALAPAARDRYRIKVVAR